MSLPSWIKAGRVKFASLTVWAMGYQLLKSRSDPEFNASTFFSYFTIESNIAGAAALLWGATSDQERRNSETVDYLRGASTLYLAITGIVYAALLAGTSDEDEEPPTLYGLRLDSDEIVEGFRRTCHAPVRHRRPASGVR